MRAIFLYLEADFLPFLFSSYVTVFDEPSALAAVYVCTWENLGQDEKLQVSTFFTTPRIFLHFASPSRSLFFVCLRKK